MSDQGLSIFDEPDDANAVDEEATQVIKAQGRDDAAAGAAKKTSGRKPVPPVAGRRADDRRAGRGARGRAGCGAGRAV